MNALKVEQSYPKVNLMYNMHYFLFILYAFDNCSNILHYWKCLYKNDNKLLNFRSCVLCIYGILVFVSCLCMLVFFVVIMDRSKWIFTYVLFLICFLQLNLWSEYCRIKTSVVCFTSTLPTIGMLFLFQVSLVAKLEIRDDSGKDMVCFLWPAQIVD